MSRPRKSTKSLDLSGAFRHDPQRREGRGDAVVVSSPLGEPPEEFQRGTPEAIRHLAAWHGIVGMAPTGVLTSADRLFVKLCAQQSVICDRPGTKTADRALLDKLLGQLGCSPAGRSKITLNKAKAADSRSVDGWAELAEERLPQKLQ